MKRIQISSKDGMKLQRGTETTPRERESENVLISLFSPVPILPGFLSFSRFRCMIECRQQRWHSQKKKNTIYI